MWSLVKSENAHCRLSWQVTLFYRALCEWQTFWRDLYKLVHLTELQASCYRADLDVDRLRHQLHMVPEVINQALPIVKQVTNVRTVCDTMNANPVTKALLGEVHKLLRLCLTVPVTCATSEHTFSALRRLKNYMRSTMRQDCLNTCMLLHREWGDSKELCVG